jgi:uncharacterized protein YeaO (DUF488 family)
LRRWFHHDPEKFEELRRRYETELQSQVGQQALAQLRDMAKQGKVTLLFAARDAEHCHALVLRDLLLQSS